MDSKRELTPNELELELRNKWQEKRRRLNTDSPNSDFAESVRAYLIQKNFFFRPLPEERNPSPLTLTPTSSPEAAIPEYLTKIN